MDNEEFQFKDVESFISFMSRKKRRLNLPEITLTAQENVSVYRDILRYLKYAILFQDMDALSTIVALESGISFNKLTEYLFEDNFLSYELNETTIEIFLNSFTIPELKDILKRNNLKSSGKKQELIDRIIEANIDLSIYTYDKVFLTKKAKEFSDEWYWVLDYYSILINFDFQDFFSYQIKKEYEYIEDVVLEYIDMHLTPAYESLDFDYILDCFDVKLEIYKIQKDFNNYLDCQMKIFNLIVNPSILSNYYISTVYSIKVKYFKKMKKLNDIFEEEIILDALEKNYNFLNQRRNIVSKEDLKDILIRVLHTTKNKVICEEIRLNYFKKCENFYIKKSDDNSQTNLDSYFK